MNKLVKKLKEMGYYKVWEGYGIKQYRKIQKYKNREFTINFDIEYKKTSVNIKEWFIVYGKISKKEEITGLRKSFNQMEKDLAILKEIEKDELEL